MTHSLKSYARSAMLASVLALTTVAITVPTIGCSAVDAQKIVALIGSQIPTAIALTNTVISVVSSLHGETVTATLPNGTVLNTGFSDVGNTIVADLGTLKNLCAQYESGKGGSVYADITNLVDKIVTEGDTGLLQAAGIKNPISKAAVMAALGGLDTILHVIDGYVQQGQTTAQVKATASRRAVKIQSIRASWDKDIMIDGAKTALAQDARTAAFYSTLDAEEQTIMAEDTVQSWQANEIALGF